MTTELRDAVVLVTGASGSIGAALRRLLTQAGAVVEGIDLVPGEGVRLRHHR